MTPEEFKKKLENTINKFFEYVNNSKDFNVMKDNNFEQFNEADWYEQFCTFIEFGV